MNRFRHALFGLIAGHNGAGGSRQVRLKPKDAVFRDVLVASTASPHV